MTFEEFATAAGVRLRAGLVAAYGPTVGSDAAAEALAYGWEHWPRVGSMSNPAGYLFRVGQTAARATRRREGFLPAPSTAELPDFEPALLPALEALSDSQRVCVLLVHGYRWTQVEVAELLEVSPSTVRTHLARALANLQQALEVSPHDH
ncbi:MAG: sigma-70 family RNA polymerase sigma factor [Acidimicrobiales bacterium]